MLTTRRIFCEEREIRRFQIPGIGPSLARWWEGGAVLRIKGHDEGADHRRTPAQSAPQPVKGHVPVNRRLRRAGDLRQLLEAERGRFTACPGQTAQAGGRRRQHGGNQGPLIARQRHGRRGDQRAHHAGKCTTYSEKGKVNMGGFLGRRGSPVGVFFANYSDGGELIHEGHQV